MSLLIPIPRLSLEALKKALNRIAPFDWVSRGSIHVFPLDGEIPSNLADDVCEYCQSNGIRHVLIPKRVHCDENRISDAGYSIISGPTIAELTRGDGLQRHLRDLKFDWRSEVMERLGQYGLGTIRESDIDRWLRQFERLGNHRAVGEHLLQLIDVLPLTDLGESLSRDSDFYGSDLVIGFNNDKWGKSWGTVSNLIKKRCPTASLFPLKEAIENGAHPKVLRLVEDGLFSGTEIRAILDSLRGRRPPGRSQKVPKLTDPSQLSKVATEVHFSVVCDFGAEVFRHYTDTNSLPNIQIAVSAAARKLRVLRRTQEVDVSGMRDGDDAFRARLRSRVIPFAFQDDKGWKDTGSMQRARNFCENVGSQLWRNYIEKKSFDRSSWPEERVSLCALGMEGLGLTFAFPHSVPKASLPLLWARGKVTAHSTSLDWVPLFPSADD